MLKNTRTVQGLAWQRVISRPSQKAEELDKFPISIYFPLRSSTVGKVPSCAAFPAMALLEEDLYAASISSGSTSPEGITKACRAQTRLG